MKAKNLFIEMSQDDIEPESEVFMSGLDKSYQNRSLQKVGKVENFGNYIVIIPGDK